MDLYRRIAHIRSEADADDLVDELIDRYGDPPRPVNNLISVALLRAAASTLGIQDIAQKGDVIRFTLKDFDVKQIARVSGLPAFQNRIRFAPDKNNIPVLTLKLKAKEDPLALVPAAAGCLRAGGFPAKTGGKRRLTLHFLPIADRIVLSLSLNPAKEGLDYLC